MKKIGVMAAGEHYSLSRLFLGWCPFLFLGMAGDRNKLFPGQRVYLYEKRRPLYGSAMVVGEAVLENALFFKDGEFPERSLFRYWAEHVAQDPELVAQIDRIGDHRLSNYKPGFIFSAALYDPEYLEYIIEHDQLPPAYNDFYVEPPIHQQMREKARKTLMDFDRWLFDLDFYDAYAQTRFVSALWLKEVKQYAEPKPVSDFVLENGKPFTRAPQYLTYTKEN